MVVCCPLRSLPHTGQQATEPVVVPAWQGRWLCYRSQQCAAFVPTWQVCPASVQPSKLMILCRCCYGQGRSTCLKLCEESTLMQRCPPLQEPVRNARVRHWPLCRHRGSFLPVQASRGTWHVPGADRPAPQRCAPSPTAGAASSALVTLLLADAAADALAP